MKKSFYKIFTSLILLATGVANSQVTNFSDWHLAGQPGIPSATADTVNGPLGSLSTFADLSSFQSATTGTVFEDFEGGLVAAGGVASCTPPVNSTSSNPCFNAGDLIPGFNLNVSTPGNLLVTLGAGIIGQASVIIGANTFTDSTDLSFDANNILAVAFDLHSNGPNPLTITVFDTIGGVIGTINTVVTTPGTPVFIGFTSATAIGSVNISDDTGAGELIDNLRFGGIAPPAIIPSSSMTSLLVLLLLIFAMAWSFRKKVQS
ncbi:MAG: hypothetical protein JKX98_09705 [Alcanivoracaceae bacterium]|nr:hypothetical protein [Alcanivoracaceae bacterium]